MVRGLKRLVKISPARPQGFRTLSGSVWGSDVSLGGGFKGVRPLCFHALDVSGAWGEANSEGCGWMRAMEDPSSSIPEAATDKLGGIVEGEALTR